MALGLLFAAAGLGLLIVASDRFVDGAAGIAHRLRLSDVVVGAVIVGFGTSAPELLVSALAAAGGSRDIAAGNIIGSNMANMTLVLGAVAIIAAPRIASRLVLREIPIVVAAMLLLAVVLRPVSRFDGAVLLVLFVAAMTAIIRVGGREDDDPIGAEADVALHLHVAVSGWRLAALTVAGLVGTVAGAQLLVTGARRVADELGLAEGFVGFTLVAIGTSLPELVTAVTASRKGQPDLALGNVVGSNLFNSLAIGGVTALISPGSVSAGLGAAAWMTVAAGVGLWVLMWTDRRLRRWEGVLLIAVYLATLPLVA